MQIINKLIFIGQISHLLVILIQRLVFQSEGIIAHRSFHVIPIVLKGTVRPKDIN